MTDAISDAGNILANATGQVNLGDVITITSQTYHEFTVAMLVIGFAVGAVSCYFCMRSYQNAETKRMRRELLEKFNDYGKFFMEASDALIRAKYEELITIPQKNAQKK